MILIAYNSCDDNKASRHETGLHLRNSLLKSVFGNDAKNRIYIGENKRPCINIENADISVSHSKKLAVAAVSFEGGFNSDVLPENTFIINASLIRIGIDVELIDKRNFLLKKRIAEKYFTDREKECLFSLEKDSFYEEFFRMWTVKESCAKLKSGGIKALKACDTFKISPLFSKKIKLGEEEYFLSVTGL